MSNALVADAVSVTFRGPSYLLVRINHRRHRCSCLECALVAEQHRRCRDSVNGVMPNVLYVWATYVSHDMAVSCTWATKMQLFAGSLQQACNKPATSPQQARNKPATSPQQASQQQASNRSATGPQQARNKPTTSPQQSATGPQQARNKSAIGLQHARNKSATRLR
jgi:hypothetical protein